LTFQPWGTPPTPEGFQGGDLYGIVDQLDYLQALGITALYLNPIFASAANHRYHTYDYYQVDPLLGGNEALRELLDAAHDRHIRIILDGVFNHTGRGFWPFHHILENGAASPYLNWFMIKNWPLRPYSSGPRRPLNYAAWWNLPALPKLNTNTPAVRAYLFDVARHWIEFGIDGWRLDVPQEIDDDDFWRTFRQVVKGANPEAYICGEIWHEAQRWLQGDQFDAVMNYLFLWPTISFFGARSLRPDYRPNQLPFQPCDASSLAQQINDVYGLYDWEINCAQLNLLDSHDMARALWIMQDDKSALRLCVLFQMTLPGAPCIYYGDEIGLSAAGDPHCRAAFPWHQELGWDHELLGFYRQATALRHAHPVLRVGSFETLFAAGDLFVFQRCLPTQEALVLFNAARTPVQQHIPLRGVREGHFYQSWPPTPTPFVHRVDTRFDVTLPAREALVLTRDRH
jgi:neopullulanase